MAARKPVWRRSIQAVHAVLGLLSVLLLVRLVRHQPGEVARPDDGGNSRRRRAGRRWGLAWVGAAILVFGLAMAWAVFIHAPESQRELKELRSGARVLSFGGITPGEREYSLIEPVTILFEMTPVVSHPLAAIDPRAGDVDVLMVLQGSPQRRVDLLVEWPGRVAAQNSGCRNPSSDPSCWEVYASPSQSAGITVEISKMQIHTYLCPPLSSCIYGWFRFRWHGGIRYDSVSRRHMRIALQGATGCEFQLLLPVDCQVEVEAPAPAKIEYRTDIFGELLRSKIAYEYQLPESKGYDTASTGQDLWVQWVDSNAESLAQFLLVLSGLAIGIGSEFLASSVEAKVHPDNA